MKFKYVLSDLRIDLVILATQDVLELDRKIKIILSYHEFSLGDFGISLEYVVEEPSEIEE